MRRFATTIFSATQHYSIVSNGCNIVPTLQRYVALKIVVANRLVQYQDESRRRIKTFFHEENAKESH